MSGFTPHRPLNVASSSFSSPFFPPRAVLQLRKRGGGSIIQHLSFSGFNTTATPDTDSHTLQQHPHTHSVVSRKHTHRLRKTRLVFFSSSRFYLANSCPFLHFFSLSLSPPRVFTITKINLLPSRFYIRHLQVQCVTCPSH